MDADDVFLAVLRPEEEREMSLAAAKAALTAEKWSAMEGESLNVRARKMLAVPVGEMNRKARSSDKRSAIREGPHAKARSREGTESRGVGEADGGLQEYAAKAGGGER